MRSAQTTAVTPLNKRGDCCGWPTRSGQFSPAIENGCTSLAFPAMSTGIYGYPLEEACKEAVDVCWAEAQRTGVGIKLVAFDGKTADCLRRHLSARMKVQSL